MLFSKLERNFGDTPEMARFVTLLCICIGSILLVASIMMKVLGGLQPTLAPGSVALDPYAHYWRLDEALTNNFADHVGGASGNCSNCPAPVPGVLGGGQDFGSAHAGITVPPSTSLDWTPAQDFSIEAWVRSGVGVCDSMQTFVGRFHPGSRAQWSLGCHRGVAVFTVDEGSGAEGPRVLKGQQALNDNRWHHVAAVRDAVTGQLRLYVDGQEDGRMDLHSTGRLPLLSGMPLTIGYLEQSSDRQQFTGVLDEVAVRGRALSAAQLDRRFNDGSTGLHLGYEACPARPVRIMPLGDSNTQRRGYRRTLSAALLNEGYDQDFVGSRKDKCKDGCPYDLDHEGHAGSRPSTIAASLPGWLGWLRRAQPDVVLLHIGTNELDVPGVEKILDTIKQHDANIVVVLGLIINRLEHDSATSEFNRQLAQLAHRRIVDGDRIRVVDHESALTYPDDMSDMLHPGKTGFEKMQEVWLKDLRRFLPACSSAPPSFISGRVLEAAAGVLFEHDVVAAGVPPATYMLMSGPPGLLLHPDTGRIHWARPIAGEFPVTIMASNAHGNATQSHALRVYE
jgi:hypothetical protein